MAHDVFISYSSKDKPVADAVCAGLEGRGVRCWVAPRDILKATLIDSEGRRSSPVSFSFEVRRASGAPPRSIEIDTGQFKFKIPH